MSPTQGAMEGRTKNRRQTQRPVFSASQMTEDEMEAGPSQPRSSKSGLSQSQASNSKSGLSQSQANNSKTGLSQSQASSSKSGLSQSQPSNISPETLERLTNDCVRFLLMADQKKIPIKRADITKNVLKDHPKMYSEVMKRAASKLNMVFGFNITELSKKGLFILTNKLENETENHCLSSAAAAAKQSLLFIVLSVIFMNGNVMQEDTLWKMLRKFDISPDVHHDLFGDVKKILTNEFVRQMYLEYKIVSGNDPPTYEFLWGQRAIHEVSKMKMLDFVCQIYNDGRKIEEWVTQFEDASEQITSDGSE